MAQKKRLQRLGLSTLLTAISIAAATPASAGGPITCMRASMANCADAGTMGSLRRCSATVMCSGGTDSTLAFFSLTDSTNVTTCQPFFSDFRAGGPGGTVTYTVSAVALKTAPTSRFCSWYWGSKGGGSGQFAITSSDGLPVELMDFSVGEPED